MAQLTKVKSVERKIFRVERFKVNFLRPGDGRNVRENRGSIPQYGYKRAASGNITVERWKQSRFLQNYSGFDVDVLYRSGVSAPGNTKLSTVRRSYDD